MKLLLAVGFLLLALTTKGFATAQYPDYVTIDGKLEPMHSNPLEVFFSKHPEKRPQSPISSTALWRGYIAYFTIADGRLQVKDIQIHDKMDPKGDEPRMKSVVNEVFPGAADRTVHWLTGFLILPQGKLVSYVHMGYASTYEGYRLLFLKEGRVLADRVFSGEEYTEYKQLQFAAYAKSGAYRKMKEAMGSETGSISAENFLYIFDVSFPMETLIDYKDFRPASISKASPAPSK